MSYTFKIREGFLLEQYWAKAKKMYIGIILALLLFPFVGITLLIPFMKTRKDFLKILKLRDEQSIKELVAIINGRTNKFT
ncbi:MAG: hypothetical protein ACFFDW_01890 [Candidatus Thorarchaeota archaeon]